MSNLPEDWETQERFGKLIRRSRLSKGYSQTQLAKLLGVDFTYLSKLENDRAQYPPSEAVLRELARQLELDEEALIFRAGRIPQHYEAFLKRNNRQMSTLFRQMQGNPQFAQRVFDAAAEGERWHD